MDEQLERFFQIFISSVEAIGEEYLYTLYYDIELIKGSEIKDRQKRFLLKSAERTICNELYFHLRTSIANYRQVHQDFLGPSILQAEVQKRQIPELLHQMRLRKLSHNFIPDFIMHTPGNAEVHAFVIEVKSNRFLHNKELEYDLNKIAEFIERYRYERGIFLAINLNMNDIQNLITTSRFSDETRRNSNRIFIVTRDRHRIECEFTTLNNLVNE